MCEHVIIVGANHRSCQALVRSCFWPKNVFLLACMCACHICPSLYSTCSPACKDENEYFISNIPFGKLSRIFCRLFIIDETCPHQSVQFYPGAQNLTGKKKKQRIALMWMWMLNVMQKVAAFSHLKSHLICWLNCSAPLVCRESYHVHGFYYNQRCSSPLGWTWHVNHAWLNAQLPSMARVPPSIY